MLPKNDLSPISLINDGENVELFRIITLIIEYEDYLQFRLFSSEHRVETLTRLRIERK